MRAALVVAILSCSISTSCATRYDVCREATLAFRESILSYCAEHPQEYCRCFERWFAWSPSLCSCDGPSMEVELEELCTYHEDDEALAALEDGASNPGPWVDSSCW